MYSRKFAKGIVDKVKRIKIALVSEDSDLILGYRKLLYYYSDIQKRDQHIEYMKRSGFNVSESYKELLYSDFGVSCDEWIYIDAVEYCNDDFFRHFVDDRN